MEVDPKTGKRKPSGVKEIDGRGESRSLSGFLPPLRDDSDQDAFLFPLHGSRQLFGSCEVGVPTFRPDVPIESSEEIPLHQA